jgi:hypothetical protein
VRITTTIGQPRRIYAPRANFTQPGYAHDRSVEHDVSR